MVIVGEKISNTDICANIYTICLLELPKIYKEAKKNIKKYADFSTVKEYGNKITIYTQMISLARDGALNKEIADDEYVLETLDIIFKELDKPDFNYEETLKELTTRLININTKYQSVMEDEKEIVNN